MHRRSANPRYWEVKFGFSQPDRLPSGGRAKDAYDPHSIQISIESQSGTIVIDQQILLAQFGTGYITVTGIELPEGNYNLTKFLVFNSAGEVIMASPVEGSEKAYLVADPLPLAFSIVAEDVNEIAVEVVAINEVEDTPEDFGYGIASFSLDPVETFSFNTWVRDYKTHVPLAANIMIQGFDVGQQLQLEHVFQSSVSSAVTIQLLNSIAYYRITVEYDGYYDLEYFLTRSQIERGMVCCDESDSFTLELASQDNYYRLPVSEFFEGPTNSLHQIFAFIPVDGCAETPWMDFGGFAPGSVEFEGSITEDDVMHSYSMGSLFLQNDNVGSDFFGVFYFQSNICNSHPAAQLIETSITCFRGLYELQLSFSWDRNAGLWQVGQLVLVDSPSFGYNPQQLFYQEYSY